MDKGERTSAQNAEGAQETQACAKALLRSVEGQPNAAKVTLFVRELRLLASAASAAEGRNQKTAESSLAGVSGSPDETREQAAHALLRAVQRMRSDPSNIVPWYVAEACDALAGVGEHRPDQPQDKTLVSAQERRAPDGDEGAS